MSFFKIGERRRREQIAHALYVTIIDQSRLPGFYTRFGVPDTLDGRFDLIVLNAFLVMRRFKRVEARLADEARELSQALFDLMFDDMDQNLRELGAGDMSVGKKVKQMARAFYGRATAYEEGLDGDGLVDALIRNLFGTVEGALAPDHPIAMAHYMKLCDAALAAQADGDVMEGRVVFVAPESNDDT
ncbi:hypothetical protein A6A04_17300 [Paramagnetospirillum marisnigri]|uniref:Ubiquinol-cytochrome c chaperone domain-containing protein n=1 Tax=Paramagnetospirillum marisnigri TaxID=1285242 RepID=A0A178MSF2_9PROT|nr:ubiquinol-cytochrome C chaperone family protein [Paramagnetospirillum marisnigri]OAN50854.1 hypothetical protein A6A04_17300 [Paramagnetospirillum marisnigri]